MGLSNSTMAPKGERLPGMVCVALMAAAIIATSPAEAQRLEYGVGDEISIEQRLGEHLPLDLSFVDETGRTVSLGDYFGEKPVVLALVYYECPMLCTQVLNGLLRSLRVLAFSVGEEFEVVTVSIDPEETAALAAAKKREYTRKYRRDTGSRGWHFLTGSNEQIVQLAESVGFRYQYDPETDLYTHASGIMVVTPKGELSRYFYGVEYAPKDLRLGLIEASENRIGNPVDQILLLCFQYDPATGKYTLAVLNSLRVAGGATVFGLAVFVGAMLRRERRLTRGAEGNPSPRANTN